MARKWLIAAAAAAGITFIPGAGNAQSSGAGFEVAGTASLATCGTPDECLAEADLALKSEDDRAALDRLGYDSYVQACAWGSGTGCYYAAVLTSVGTGTAQSEGEAYEQLLQVGCQLDHQMSCYDASLEALVAGRRAEAWAFLAVAARLAGNHMWEEDVNNALSPRLPDGRIVLPPVGELPWAPEGVGTALTCASYWLALDPASPEAAGWQAAARAAFVAWPPLAGQPARTAAEADQWIADQQVTWRMDEPANDYSRLTASRCYMGRRPLLSE